MNKIKQFFKNIFCSKDKKIYNKMYKSHRKELIKHAKNTKEWDWSYLQDSVLMQIKHMYEYYKNGNNVWQSDESRLEIVEQLKEVLDIFDEIEKLDNCDTYYDYRKQTSYYIISDTKKLDVKEYYKYEDELYIKLYSTIGKYIRYWWD